jgi:hypothetical protein
MIYERTERISTFIMKDVTMMIVELCYRDEELKSPLFFVFVCSVLLRVNLYIHS